MMVHHLSGGGWGMPVRRIFEASARTLPFMALLGIPILLGMHHIYEWTDTAKVAADPILLQKQPYLNIPFFVARYALYFVIWTGLAYTLSGWSRSQDTNYEPGSERKFRLVSGPGILLYAVASTFAVVDWLMSLDPHWFSTIFGLLFLIQQALAAMGFVLLLMASMSKTLPMSRIVRASDIHDYGKFLLAFVMIWAYFSFSQFLIIWSANLPEEIPWYLERMSHGWEWFSILLIVGQFFLPFFLLLSRDLKRTAGRLAIVGGAGPGDALRRLLLERDAGAEPRDADAALDQPGDARRRRRHLGLALRRAVQGPRRCCRSAIRIFRRRLRAMADTNKPDVTHVDPGGEVHGHGVRAASAAVHHEVTDIPLGGLTRAALIATSSSAWSWC